MSALVEPEKEKGTPILDRIMSSGETLGASRREIIEDMIRLANQNDIAGMQSLFNAYKNWEIREKKPGISDENVERLAKRNFDIVARVADAKLETGSDLLAMVRAADRGYEGGRITKFYRSSVGYAPPKQRTHKFSDN